MSLYKIIAGLDNIKTDFIIYINPELLWKYYIKLIPLAQTALDVCGSYNHFAEILTRQITLDALSREYELEVSVTTFNEFLLKYDRKYLFTDASSTYYRINRYKLNFSSLEALRSACKIKDVRFINHVLDTESLRFSYPHVEILAKGLCYDVNLVFNYLNIYGAYYSDKFNEYYWRLSKLAYTQAYKKRYDIKQYTHYTCKERDLHEFIIGCGRWEDLDKISYPKTFNFYICAIKCNNKKLLNDIKLIPEYIKRQLDMTMPTKRDIIDTIVDYHHWKLLDIFFNVNLKTDMEVIRKAIRRQDGNSFMRNFYKILSTFTSTGKLYIIPRNVFSVDGEISSTNTSPCQIIINMFLYVGIIQLYPEFLMWCHKRELLDINSLDFNEVFRYVHINPSYSLEAIRYFVNKKSIIKQQHKEQLTEIYKYDLNMTELLL